MSVPFAKVDGPGVVVRAVAGRGEHLWAEVDADQVDVGRVLAEVASGAHRNLEYLAVGA